MWEKQRTAWIRDFECHQNVSELDQEMPVFGCGISQNNKYICLYAKSKQRVNKF